MIAASRLLNCCRTVLPYAQWVYVAIQLGYVGYNYWERYRSYLEQMRHDSQNGTERTLKEVMELVIKPRRRIRGSNRGPTSNLNNSNTDRLGEPIASTSGCNIGVEETSICDKENSDSNNLVKPPSDDAEVLITHESPFSQFQHPADDDASEIHSKTSWSTSLESTDSNNGIVKDMYSECFICATPLDNPKKPVATLPFCMHPFHKTCLDSVLKWHQRCPVCDFHIFSPI